MRTIRTIRNYSATNPAPKGTDLTDFPPMRTMLSLACLGECQGGYSTSDGRLVVVLPAGTSWEILIAELDELERRRWVTLEPPQEGDAANTARVRVSDDGRYWLKRWAKKHKRELTEMAGNLGHKPGSSGYKGGELRT